METARTKVIVSLHLCGSSQRRLSSLISGSGLHPAAGSGTVLFYTHKFGNTTHHNPVCVFVRTSVLFCCIVTPVERRGSQTQIPWAIFGSRGNIFTVVIHPAPDNFPPLPSNNCCSIVALQASPKQQAAQATQGKLIKVITEQRVGQQQEVTPQREANETEGAFQHLGGTDQVEST